MVFPVFVNVIDVLILKVLSLNRNCNGGLESDQPILKVSGY